ncbi:hypothetical protein G4Y79_17875 [Phototrophicus methaneseepsis]|uniref:Chitinase n=1 Tax=Phototrophicus methaneseepsis TaxID=2710758 RepID=A0A7S8E706_9CHLR|nr:hypothetical protein [Phototrophicus methaneseepsis]QPC81543.1 hypothetical protein G4Y79_17875 [Phototrophicus methaneseepsis]
MQRSILRQALLTALFVVMAGVLSISVIAPTTVQAQFEEPTATPTDPVWLAFSEARDAITEAEGVDLTTVLSWEFWQDDWSIPNAAHPANAAGIDSCVSTVGIAQGREVYFGWTFRLRSMRGVDYEARVSFDLNDVAICDIMSEDSAAAPAATAVDNPDLPDPVAGAAASGSFELGGHVTGLTGAAENAMSTAGMKWVKYQLPTTAGVQKGYDLINSTQARGFKVLLSIVGSKEELGADPDGYIAEYATFVRALAEAGADGLEIWNEPNIDREWPAGQINGANYTKLLAAAYNAIKGVRPATLVISAAPTPTGFFGAAGCTSAGCNDDTFLQQMAQAGAANYMDCVGMHYNEGVLPPTATSGDPRGQFPTYYLDANTNRATSAFPGKQVCYTELGYLSGEGMGTAIPSAYNWSPNDPVTVAEQASYLAGAATRLAQRGDIRLMIVWNINFTDWDPDPMGGYAIIRPDGSCPACTALGTVMGG